MATTDVAKEIKDRIDIVDFIGSYIEVKKSGRNFKACCPFHQEKSPSFIISPERQIWHCFGACHVGGDVISFLMKWENITYGEALRELAQKVGVRLDNEVADEFFKQKDRLYAMHEAAEAFYHYVLMSTQVGQKAREYLALRTVRSAVIKTFSLGYAPDSWDALLKYLTKKGFALSEMGEAGLVIKSPQGSYYDRFRGRIMFPIKDMRLNTVGFAGRLLDPQAKQAKYVNSPETPIYRKRETLYGIHVTKDAIRKDKYALLVEGEFDMIVPYQNGIEQVVAIKGSAVTQEQLRLLKRLAPKVLLMLDTDEAGQDAILRTIEAANEVEMEIYVVEYDGGKDPDEASRTSLIALKKAIASPTPIYDYLFRLAQKKHDLTSPFGKQRMSDEIVAVLQRINNPIVKSYYVKRLAEILTVSEESIYKQITFVRNRAKKRSIIQKKQQNVPSREHMLERYILSKMVQGDVEIDVMVAICGTLEEEDFTIPAYGKLMTMIRMFIQQEQSYNHQSFAHYLPAELVPAFDELYLFTTVTEAKDLAQASLPKLAYELKRATLKRTITTLLTQDDPEAGGHLADATKKLHEIEKKMAKEHS